MKRLSIQKGKKSLILGEKLGEGLNATVYKAVYILPDGSKGFSVAVKVPKSQTLFQAWKSEILSLSQVRSPHCNSAMGFEQINGQWVIVMPLIEGVSLREFLNHSPISKTVALELIRQIHLGLTHLQRSQLCHGDLHLGNVMISVAGEVILVDYGMANGVKMSGISHRYFAPEFAAPEVLSGASPTFESDLYSLGKLAQKLGLHFHPAIRNLVHEKPTLRALQPLEESKVARFKIATRTKEICNLNHSRQGTSPMPASDKGVSEQNFSAFPRFTLLAIQLILTFSCFFLITSSGRAPAKMRMASVSFRSRDWSRVWIEGKVMGYTPLSLKNLPPGKYRFECEKVNPLLKINDPVQLRTKALALTLKAGENILVVDCQSGGQNERGHQREF